VSYIIWSQARPRPFTLVPKISAFTPVKVSTCVFLIACLSLSAWTQWRLHAVDSSPSKTVYTCLKSPLLHPSKFIHGTSQCQRRPVTLGPMAAARGGIKPVQGRLHLSKISDFTPVQKSHSLHLWKISGHTCPSFMPEGPWSHERKPSPKCRNVYGRWPHLL